jgi:hypothetical protein
MADAVIIYLEIDREDLTVALCSWRMLRLLDPIFLTDNLNYQ